MNQQNEGLGSSTPSNVPNKRKRGRPRKEKCGVQGNHISGDVSNSNQTAPTNDGYQRQMVGKLILGVIEGTFDGGYLIKVQIADTDLRGAVFLPGQVVPVTAENDVAPHVRIIERNDVQIPVLNPVTQVHNNSVSSSKQRNKQPFQPALQVPMPMPISQVRPTDLPKIDSMSTRGQAKESTTDGGATKDSQKIYQVINLVPTAENTEKELRTGQQSVPSVHKVNELIPDEPNFSDIEIEKMGEEVWNDWQI